MFNQINKTMKTLLNLVSVMILLSPPASFAQWSSDPMANTPIDLSPEMQSIPKAATDQLSGNVFIAYYSLASGNFDVMLQYLNHQGYPIWPEPLVVSNHIQDLMLTDLAAVADIEGNCVIAFSDLRNGSLDVYVYKISPDGQFLYGEDGIRLSDNSGEEFSPVLCMTTDNSAIVSWIEENAETGNQFVMAAIDNGGNLLWNDGRITWVPDGDYSYANPYLVTSGNGEFIVIFSRNSGPPWSPFRLLYAQRIDFFGDPVWQQEAIINEAGGLSAWDILNIKTDDQGGFYVAWNDDRDLDQVNDSFIQHVDASGNTFFEPNGMQVSTSFAHKCLPLVAGYNDNNDIYVFWTQTKITKDDEPALFGQRISASGARLWTGNGKEIIPNDKGFYMLDGCDVRNNLSYIFFEMYGDDITDRRIRAKCLDPDGNSAWDFEHISVSEVRKEAHHQFVSDYSGGQWIMVWSDTRDTVFDLYAQNINEDGSIGNPTGINEHDQQQVDVYPNPCHETLNISQTGYHQIHILNMAGQVVMEENIKEGVNSIKVGNLNPGIYIIKLTGQKGTTSERLGIIGY